MTWPANKAPDANLTKQTALAAALKRRKKPPAPGANEEQSQGTSTNPARPAQTAD